MTLILLPGYDGEPMPLWKARRMVNDYLFHETLECARRMIDIDLLAKMGAERYHAAIEEHIAEFRTAYEKGRIRLYAASPPPYNQADRDFLEDWYE